MDLDPICVINHELYKKVLSTVNFLFFFFKLMAYKGNGMYEKNTK